jgi:hypothetical protein
MGDIEQVIGVTELQFFAAHGYILILQLHLQ